MKLTIRYFGQRRVSKNNKRINHGLLGLENTLKTVLLLHFLNKEHEKEEEEDTGGKETIKLAFIIVHESCFYSSEQG